jgi:hypothetical protein
MPMPQLKVLRSSGSDMLAVCGQPAEDRRQCPCAKVDLAGQPFGQDARRVLGQAAAGDMGKAVDPTGADAASACLT